MAYFSEELITRASGALSPDVIMSKLVYFRDQAHYIHFNTTSFAVHKALDSLYSSLDGWVDSVGELLLGYIAPRRFTFPTPIRVDVRESPAEFVNNLCRFADALYEYGESTKWWALSNMAAEISGDGYKAKYLLTLT